MSWIATTPDMTADWSEVTDWLVDTAEASTKTVTGQEARATAARSGREVSLARLRGQDTGKQRKSPAVEWLWTASLVLSYPGRLKKGATAAALNDAQRVAELLTTGNPERGWRITVTDVDSGTSTPDTFAVTLTVTVLTYWRHGSPQGTSPTSAQATAYGGTS